MPSLLRMLTHFLCAACAMLVRLHSGCSCGIICITVAEPPAPGMYTAFPAPLRICLNGTLEMNCLAYVSPCRAVALRKSIMTGTHTRARAHTRTHAHRSMPGSALTFECLLILVVTKRIPVTMIRMQRDLSCFDLLRAGQMQQRCCGRRRDLNHPTGK